MKKSPLTLDKDRKQQVIHKLITYIDDEWELEIGSLKAELLLDFLTETMGAELYNRGVGASREFLLKRMEEMDLDMDQLKL
ncbi:MAG: DUF2164 domain-containing protein [Spirochaetales bacterium]|nr:DUF2164 domain-containing protein [Spirochaetales bacterium]